MDAISPSGFEARKAGKIVRKAIGDKLRALYDEVAQEPVPDRFTDLLKRLEAGGGEPAGTGGGDADVAAAPTGRPPQDEERS